MIYQQGHERKATVHITALTEEAERRTDWCEACCRNHGRKFWSHPCNKKATIAPFVHYEPLACRDQRPNDHAELSHGNEPLDNGSSCAGSLTGIVRRL